MLMKSYKIKKPGGGDGRASAPAVERSTVGEYLDVARGHVERYYNEAYEAIRSPYREKFDKLNKESTEFAKEFGISTKGPDGEDGGSPADAFRHAYSFSEVALEYGSFVADIAGDFHELKGSFKDRKYAEGFMDIANNATAVHGLAPRARELNLSTKQERAKLVNEALRQGKLFQLEKQSNGSLKLVPTGEKSYNKSGGNPSKPAAESKSAPAKPAPTRTERPGRGDWDGSFGRARQLPADIRFDRPAGRGNRGGTMVA